MAEGLSGDGISPGQRLLAAVVAVVCMWIAAWFGVVVGLVAPISGIETGDPESGEILSRVAFAGAVVVFLLSAPAGYLISRRRWMLLAPLALGVINCGWRAGRSRYLDQAPISCRSAAV